VRVAVIVNPVAGVAGTYDRARRRAEQAADLLTTAGVEPDILITERAGHARELARGAADRGARIVVAWGGDGTVNEVAAALSGGPAALGIVPAGSGNGLARFYGLPPTPEAAFDRLIHGADRQIDVGEANGRLFVNVAGVGFDATVAARFAALGRSRRGFLRYGLIVLDELRRFRPVTFDVTIEDAHLGERTVALLSFANGRQWGNGAVIAPHADPGDGLLDVVMAEATRSRDILRAVPRLFSGTIDRARGVTIRRARTVRIGASGPLPFHVDGEAAVADGLLAVRVRPAALRIRV
jgi:diacylglycerol kinase (ATP)